jgi:uncharacterized membrane protein
MPSSTNYWMCFAGLVYLVTGVCIHRKEVGMACGWNKLIALGSTLIAVSLATFAPEHFRGPAFVQESVPSWMPGHAFWAYLVGCALFAAATSLALDKFVRLSSSLLGLMFILFVCMIFLPYAVTHPHDRFGWAYALRDLSFAAGAWALAGERGRASSPEQARWMISFARIVLAIAAVFYAVQHFLHPEFAPGVPLEEMMPAGVPFPIAWAYLAGVILLAAGIALALNRRSRMAATAIGALMTALTLGLYLPLLMLTRNRPTLEINDAINSIADTLLYAGASLALASALPRSQVRVEKA